MSVTTELASAVREVIYHSQDMDPTEALVKVAEEHKLNVEKIKRVAEASNNLRVLHMYKTAKNKAEEIPLADSALAIKKLNLKDDSPRFQEKEASCRELDRFYKVAECNYRDARSAGLRANLLDGMLKVAEQKYPEASSIGKMLKKAETLKREVQTSSINKQHARDTLELSVIKLAQYLKYHQDIRFPDFEKEAYLLHGPEIKPVMSMIASMLPGAERFTGELTHELVKDAGEHFQVLEQVLACFVKYAELYKENQEVTRVGGVYEEQVKQRSSNSFFKQAASAKVPNYSDSQQLWDRREQLINWHTSKEPEQQNEFNKLKEPTEVLSREKQLFSGGNNREGKEEKGDKVGFKMPDSGGGGGGSGGIKPLESFKTFTGSLEGVQKFIGGAKKPDLQPDRLRSIAVYAMKHDPILSSRNPHAIIQAFKTMIKVSPSLAHDPNAAISFLRQATMGDTVSYASLKDLADTEKSMAETKARKSGSPAK